MRGGVLLLLFCSSLFGAASWAQETEPMPPMEGLAQPAEPLQPLDAGRAPAMGEPGIAPPEGVAGLAPGTEKLPVLQVGANFLVSVSVRADQVGGETLLLRLVSTSEGTHEVTVFDDGKGHDHTAGDGRYSAEVSGYPSGPVDLVLLSETENEIWRVDGFEVPDTMEYPALRLKMMDGVIAGGLVEDVPVSSSGMGGLADYEKAGGGGVAIMGMRHLMWLGIAGVLGCSVAFLLTGIRSGMGEVDHGLLAPEMADSGLLPGLERGAQAWSVGDASARRQVLIEVASREAGNRPVLVVPQSASREVLGESLKARPGIAWPRMDRPGVLHLLRLGQGLLQPTHGVVIVEGAGALESPAPGEESDEVLVEFLEKNRSDTLVLVCDGEELEYDVQRVRLDAGRVGPGLA